MKLNLPKSWANKLNDIDLGEIQKFLTSEVKKEKVIYPDLKNIFSAFELTPFEEVKVVIIGQDPYHGPGQAHGLAFSVQEGTKHPPSLKNIFKELESDLGILATSGDLSPWARSGVLLLNDVLTVEQAKAGSHQKIGWQVFTDQVIALLNTEKENLVFVLWGSHAQKKGRIINREKHFVIEGVHPSPLSAYRGFFGQAPFSKVNDYLKERKIKAINWKC